MTDEFEWTDRLTIVIRGTELTRPNLDEQVVIQVYDGEAWDRSWLLSELRKLGRTPSGDTLYKLRTDTAEFCWGGDGSTANILLEIAHMATEGLVGGAAWELAKELGRRAMERKRQVERPLTDAEAEARARWQTEQRYELANGTLIGRSVEVKNQGRSAYVQLIDPTNGTVYDVELGNPGGLVTYTLIKRTLA